MELLVCTPRSLRTITCHNWTVASGIVNLLPAHSTASHPPSPVQRGEDDVILYAPMYQLLVNLKDVKISSIKQAAPPYTEVEVEGKKDKWHCLFQNSQTKKANVETLPQDSGMNNWWSYMRNCIMKLNLNSNVAYGKGSIYFNLEWHFSWILGNEYEWGWVHYYSR